MDFYIILQEIMEEKNLKIPDVARICDLSDGTVRSAIKRKQKSVSLDVAFKLSSGLGVSLERLNGMPEKPTISTSIKYTQHEVSLIEAYRVADQTIRKVVDTALEDYIPASSKNVPPTKAV